VEERSAKTHADEILSRDSAEVRQTRDVITDGPVDGPARDCCLTYIRFEKLYPGDVKAKVTLGDGRSLKREFTNAKKIRTAVVTPTGLDEDDTHTALVGGLGPCVDVDVEIMDTSTNPMKPVHYHFRLCCNDPAVRKGASLTARINPPNPGGQVVKLPLLGIKEVRSDPCP